ERWGKLRASFLAPNWWGVVWILAGSGILLIGLLGAEMFSQRISLVIILAGLVLLTCGKEYLRILSFPLAFLFFMIPLPAIVMNAIAFPLQIFAAKTAAFCLYNFGIPVLREGNVIVLAETTLEVAEACSGIRSLQALMALGTVYAYFSQSSFLRRGVLVVCSIPIAIAANAVRVSGTGVLAHYWGAEAAQGFYHTFEGWIVFVVAVLLLLVTGALLAGTGSRAIPSSVSQSQVSLYSPQVAGVFQVKPFVVAIAMLACVLTLDWSLSHGEVVPTKQAFSSFPLQIADRWSGKELALENEVLKVLRLSDYMMRVYLPHSLSIRDVRQSLPTPSSRPGGVQVETTSPTLSTPVWLYVGYYGSQRTGATYHSPKNCLPGAGWQFVESNEVAVSVYGSQITINQVTIQKGLDKQVILYWYHDRGRVIASEYWAKAYLLWDAATENRTDGALVRISVPVTTTVEAAQAHALLFLQDSWPLILDFMPAGVKFEKLSRLSADSVPAASTASPALEILDWRGSPYNHPANGG
ncbi:MAG TPA: EpsI family protein, partial [Nitrospira sp.]|nr:EpsI family protein [Nitrospira sp.]